MRFSNDGLAGPGDGKLSVPQSVADGPSSGVHFIESSRFDLGLTKGEKAIIINFQRAYS